MAVDPDKPFNREEMYLAKAAGEGTTVPDEPWSRKEAYLDKIGGRIAEAEEDISELDTKVAALATDLSYKGGVADYAHLPNDPAQGDVYTTEDTGILYVWDGTQWVALNDSLTVVQTIGKSTTDVMSQKAVSDQIFYNSGNTYTRENIRIGHTNMVGYQSTSIGYNQTFGNLAFSVAIGANSSAGNDGVVIVGNSAVANKPGAVAIGYGSSATTKGEMNIGTTSTSYGYASSNYRLLTGLYDPQSAHDAATKGYVDTHLGGLSFVALTQTEYDNLGTKDPDTLYIIKAA